MSALVFALGLGIAVFATLGLLLLALLGDKSAAQVRLEEVTAGPRGAHGFELRDLLSFVTRVVAPVRSLLGLKASEDLPYRLSVAGYREPEDLDTFLNAKLLGPVLGVLLATFTGRNNMVIAMLVLAALGFFAPDLFLIRATSKRKEIISLTLPNAIDLLVVCVEAGLGIDQAVLRVAKEIQLSSPELSDELNVLAREQRAGKPRAEAWRSFADRVDLDSVRQFANMLTQSERLGTPIARTLAQFADDLRHKRLMQAEERASKIAIKLIFPLAIFIFPAMFIVILGPAGLNLAKAFK